MSAPPRRALAIGAALCAGWALGNIALAMVAPPLFQLTTSANALNPRALAGEIFGSALTTWAIVATLLALVLAVVLAIAASISWRDAPRRGRVVIGTLVLVLALHAAGATTLAMAQKVRREVVQQRADAFDVEPGFLAEPLKVRREDFAWLHKAASLIMQTQTVALLGSTVLLVLLIGGGRADRAHVTVATTPPAGKRNKGSAA